MLFVGLKLDSYLQCSWKRVEIRCRGEVFCGKDTRNTGCFIMLSVITNICNKKTKEPTLMELFTATGKLKKFFLTTIDVRCVHRW